MLLNVMIAVSIIWLVAPEPLNQVIAFFLSPFKDSFFIMINLADIATGIIVLILSMLVHELLHLAFFPGPLRSDKTYLGITYAGVYVVTEEKLTRKRFFLISLAPFIVISILLPLMLGAVGILGPWLVVVALLNALGSSMDLFGLLMVVRQVPPGARLQCAGMDTYWKAYHVIRAATA